MVVTLCFPNNAGNGFQDATTTLTFTFSAQQRSGAAA
jgi:hypothetical protein